MNIGIYKRKSIFSDKSDSIDTQSKICREYAYKNYTVSSIVEYEDEGFSGANTDRPGYKKLMEDVKNKKIDILICYKIDRISRNVSDFSSTFNILQKHNIQFVSVKEQIDTSTPLGRAMMYICSVFAQMERETIAERVKDNLIELAKSGKWPGGKAPIGYKREKVLINGKYHTVLVKNEPELNYLNMIYNKFLQGNSLGKMETYFRKNGIKTITGNYLHTAQIHQILKNPQYVAATKEIYDYFSNKGCIMACDRDKFTGENGLLVYGRTTGGKKKLHTNNPPENWIVTVGLHKPLIAAEKWLEVQNKFSKNKIDKTRKHEIGLLKGILKCKCGYLMRVHHKVDKQYNQIYNYYFCQKRNRKGAEYCDLKMIDVDLLDNKFINILVKLSTDKQLLMDYVNKLPETDILNRDIEMVKKDILSVNRKIQNLTAALQENSESVASKYIISEIEKLDTRLIELNYELREIGFQESSRKTYESNVEIVHSKIVYYLKNFDSFSYNEKTEYLHEFIKECFWDGKKLTITI